MKASVKSRAAPKKKRIPDDVKESATKKVQKTSEGEKGEKQNKPADPVPEKPKTPQTPKTPVGAPEGNVPKHKGQNGSTAKHLDPSKDSKSEAYAPASESQPKKRLREKSGQAPSSGSQPSEIEKLSKVCSYMVSVFFWDSGLRVLFP